MARETGENKPAASEISTATELREDSIIVLLATTKDRLGATAPAPGATSPGPAEQRKKRARSRSCRSVRMR
jgi:hypothetical protein